jgi:hypothetical protein
VFAPSRRLLVGRVFRTGPASVDYGSLNLTFQSVCAWGRRAPSLRARKWSGQAIATGPSEKPRAVKHCPRKTKHIGICRAERERVGGYPPARLWGGPSACRRWSTSLRPRRRPLRESKCRRYRRRNRKPRRSRPFSGQADHGGRRQNSVQSLKPLMRRLTGVRSKDLSINDRGRPNRLSACQVEWGSISTRPPRPPGQLPLGDDPDCGADYITRDH